MTYTTHTATGLRAASVWQRLSDLKATWTERHAQRLAFRRTMDELSALSDRDLTDMGIHRADIGAIAQQAAYGA